MRWNRDAVVRLNLAPIWRLYCRPKLLEVVLYLLDNEYNVENVQVAHSMMMSLFLLFLLLFLKFQVLTVLSQYWPFLKVQETQVKDIKKKKDLKEIKWNEGKRENESVSVVSGLGFGGGAGKGKPTKPGRWTWERCTQIRPAPCFRHILSLPAVTVR